MKAISKLLKSGILLSEETCLMANQYLIFKTSYFAVLGVF